MKRWGARRLKRLQSEALLEQARKAAHALLGVAVLQLALGSQVNLLLTSTSSNSAYFSSREGSNPPELIVLKTTP